LQLVPLLLQHVLRSSLGKCEQRAIDTLLRTSEPEKLVVVDEQLVLKCPCCLHEGYDSTLTVNTKILHQMASAAGEFAASNFSAAAEAHVRATMASGDRAFPDCGHQFATYWNDPDLQQEVGAALRKVADVEAEQVRACELQQRQYLFSIVNYSAVETAHCQVEDLRNRIQHELVMRKVTKGVWSSIIMMRIFHS
jgi:hypothetical protein